MLEVYLCPEIAARGELTGDTSAAVALSVHMDV